MKRWLHTVELSVDEIIPLLLVVLLVVSIIETAFPESHIIRLSVDIYDGIVVLVFISDLTFKYHRMRNNVPGFLRKYWLEIVASFPLFLVIRFLEFAGFAQRAVEGQQVARSVRQLREVARASRLLRFTASLQEFKFYERA